MNFIYEFIITPNAGGGDCLYRAIATYLGKTENEHGEIREKVCRYIEENWTDYKNFLITQHHEEVPYLSTVKNRMEEMTQEEIDIAEVMYLEYMKRRGSYGTITELIAASKLFKFNFNVIQEHSSEKVTVGAEFTNPTYRWAYFLFTGDFRRGHWVMVNPILDKICLFPATYKTDNSKKNRNQYRIIYVGQSHDMTPKSATVLGKQSPEKRKAEDQLQEVNPQKVLRIVERERNLLWATLDLESEDDLDNLPYQNFSQGSVELSVAHLSEEISIVKLNPGTKSPSVKAKNDMTFQILKGTIQFCLQRNNKRYFTDEISVKKDQNYSFENCSVDQLAYVCCNIKR